MENKPKLMDIFGDSETTFEAPKDHKDDDFEIQPISRGRLEDVIKIDDQCRGDDKFRCGSTSIYICEVQKCDGISNCPSGEDEVNCPSGETTEGSGEVETGIEPEEKRTEKEDVAGLEVEPEIETPGDLLIFFFKIIVLI